MPVVLVTGASGFVGGPVCGALREAGWRVRGAIRSESDGARLPSGVEPIVVGSIGAETPWESALAGADAVVHLAARTHVMAENAQDPLAVYREINVGGTQRLARSAVAMGIRRFVFLSSVKVNGEGLSNRPYLAEDAPQPEDPYGISKWEAEGALGRIAAESGLGVVVLRSPLVYGPGVKANFLQLMRAVDRGIPLPVAAIENKRSLIYVGNLAGAIAACATQPKAAGRTYLVSDGEDVSTAELVRRIARAMGRSPRVFRFPRVPMEAAAYLLGRAKAAKRLFGSLLVDSSAIRAELDWVPPFTMDQGLRETAAWFQNRPALARLA